MHTEGHSPPLQEPMEECPPKDQTKKQVRFNVDEGMGGDTTLPMDLTTFLVGGTAEEWDNTPSPCTPLSVDAPKPLHSGCQKHHLIHMGRACLKVPIRPSASFHS